MRATLLHFHSEQQVGAGSSSSAATPAHSTHRQPWHLQYQSLLQTLQLQRSKQVQQVQGAPLCRMREGASQQLCQAPHTPLVSVPRPVNQPQQLGMMQGRVKQVQGRQQAVKAHPGPAHPSPVLLPAPRSVPVPASQPLIHLLLCLLLRLLLHLPHKHLPAVHLVLLAVPQSPQARWVPGNARGYLGAH
jgi:hypothetical protein